MAKKKKDKNSSSKAQKKDKSKDYRPPKKVYSWVRNLEEFRINSDIDFDV